MSFIFISYSRQDQAYVSLLAQALETHSLPVWIDDRIDYGTTWPRVIQDHLEQCRAFIVVMSPRAEDSHWVQCELSLALELKKPIYPILLEGRRWLSVAALQTADTTDGQLPPARFFDTLRPDFPVPIPTAQTLPLQAVAADTPVGWAPPTTNQRFAGSIFLSATASNPMGWAPPTNHTQSPTEADNLSSEKGIDYRNLRDLLKAGQWREADEETYNTMLRAVGKEPSNYFTSNELLNFPCNDLLTIDRLWVKYSNGKFGFSVQKKIYVECGAKLDGEYPGDKIWSKFCDRVGWRKSIKYLSYSDLNADPSLPPAGEFPLLACGVASSAAAAAIVAAALSGVVVWRSVGFLFSRTETCKL